MQATDVLELLLSSLIVLGFVGCACLILLESRRGVRYRKPNIDTFDYLFRPMPNGTLSPNQPYAMACLWLGGAVFGGFLWMMINYPKPSMVYMSIVYVVFFTIALITFLVESEDPVKSRYISMVLWGYGDWAEQIMWGVIIAIPFMIANLYGIMMTQVKLLAVKEMYIASFLISVVMIPIAEESVFRGFLASTLSEKFGVIIGSTLSAWAFAIFHAFAYQLDVGMMMVAFVFGLIAAVVDMKFMSVLPSWIAHTLINLSAYLAYLPKTT